MAISWLDSDGLTPLLDGGTSLVIVNDAEPETEATIVGFACALHDGGNSPEVRRSTDVALEPGESFASVEDCLSPKPPMAVEAIVRILAPNSRAMSEVYVRSKGTRTKPIDSIEIGIIATEQAPADAVPVPDVEDLSAYLRLEP